MSQIAKKPTKKDVEEIKLSDLHLDPANTRHHQQRSVDAIKASLQRFGQQKLIVIDKQNIVRAGNGTLMAAKELGWKSLKCLRTELTGSELTAFAIADNRTAELSDWSNDVLDVIGSLKLELPDLDFKALGLDDINLEDHFNIDEVGLPELPSGEKSPFEQMTFTLSNNQSDNVREAIKLAKIKNKISEENENSNGNALAFICQEFIRHG